MTEESSWRLQVVRLGPWAVGAVPWTYRGEGYLSTFVKASYAVTASGTLEQAAPEPLLQKDAFVGRQLVQGREDYAALPHAEITCVGFAYPSKPGDTRSEVVLTVGRGKQILLRKAIAVLGSRSSAGDEPRPFERIPVSFERAPGGLDSDDNPLGTEPGEGTQPNLLPASADMRGIPCLAPMPRKFPARSRLLRDFDPKRLDTLPIELPSDFDWRYFHAAPEEQRVARLQGDEWWSLSGMRPDGATLQAALPSVGAHARLYGGAARGIAEVLPLRPERLHVDADGARLVVVWRGHFHLDLDRPLDDLVLAGMLVPVASSPTFPDRAVLPAAVEQAAGRGRGSSPAFSATVSIDSGLVGSAALPFGGGAAEPAAPVGSAAQDWTSTIALDRARASSGASSPTPFDPPPSRPSAPERVDDAGRARTPSSPGATPFDARRAAAPARRPSSADGPTSQTSSRGVPWSELPSGSVAKPSAWQARTAAVDADTVKAEIAAEEERRRQGDAELAVRLAGLDARTGVRPDAADPGPPAPRKAARTWVSPPAFVPPAVVSAATKTDDERTSVAPGAERSQASGQDEAERAKTEETEIATGAEEAERARRAEVERDEATRKEAERAARQKAEAEATARREAEAERFRAEQQQADEAERRRRQAVAEADEQRSKELRSSLYGFKRKR